MERRRLLHLSSAAGAVGALAAATRATTSAADAAPGWRSLHPPADGSIEVAILLSRTAVMIDFAGPWEVFQDVVVPGRTEPHPFRLYTVAETTAPIVVSGGMTIVPDYTIVTAPRPGVLVIPAQDDPGPAVLDWIRGVARTADMTMSVCAGAFLLAKAGLLSGREATTHHHCYTELAALYPDIIVRRGLRFVDLGRVATSGGLSSGIDLALHVVERYFGRAVATDTADTMEYQGVGWHDPGANRIYAERPRSNEEHPLCAVCEMIVDGSKAPTAMFHGRRFCFCSEPHRQLFEAEPSRFATG